MAIRHTALACLLALSAIGAQAQVSLDELDEAMNARDDEMSAFRERLNDPEPNRALAAMRLLIEQGDSDQRQMAIEHGLSSTDPEIRVAAVGAILQSRPILVSRWYPADGEISNNFRNRVVQREGTISVDNTARVPLYVGKRFDDANCWLINGAAEMSQNCLFRLNAGEISYWIDSAWTEMSIDTAGRLVGSPMIGGVRTEVVVDLGL